MIETLKKGVLRYRTPLEKLTSGLPKGSPSRPGNCLNANRQSDSFTPLEIATRKFLPHSGRHPVQFAFGTDFEDMEPEPKRAGRFLYLLDHEFGTWVGWIYEKADHGRFGREFVSVRRTTPSNLPSRVRSLLINWQVNGHALRVARG